MNQKAAAVRVFVALLFGTVYVLFTTSANAPAAPPKDHNGVNGSDYAAAVHEVSYRTRSVVCSKYTFLLVVVHSAVRNFKLRQSIRDTWADARDTWRQEAVRTVFILGESEDVGDQSRVDEENHIHNDVVQARFLDSYANLTRKHFVALKYATESCQSADHIVKVDDDVFINLPAIISYLSTSRTKDNIMCNVLKHEFPNRNPRHKLFISEKEYPDNEYPPFCMGMAIIYSRHAANMLVTEAENAKFIDKIDDVYFGGILPRKLRIPLEDLRGKYSETGANTLEWVRSGDARPAWFYFALVWHRPRGGMKHVWMKVRANQRETQGSLLS
ncbi:PREDICTED: beta-1,3-galactosyltransferase 5-like [Priapulus caudatus]|uniref:Hexosyltransferase n=1 Tax=Priapulus caudatus TaxID=37621 RepID=A0ABM1DP94_PRICU|nr:PREDICTED: beta-1,3-galactosyltransferase 5-like [Priapulus caudatus]